MEKILQAQRHHLQLVKEYRCVQTRYSHMSEGSCRDSSENASGLLKLDVDFCDQSKFKVPRNTSSSKTLESLWRPQLHLGGCLVWGET